MERTGFRVIEWAGLSIAVDSSEDLVWDWSDRGLEERACSGSEVDIHVGVMSTSWTGSGGLRFMPKVDVLKDWLGSTAG
jgi:hypothetical protein